jgi:murein DD-endopeptidase MepM/ murein hydrolase activator NlpD
MYKMPLDKYNRGLQMKPRKKSKRFKILFLIIFLLAIYGAFHFFRKPKEIIVEQVEEITQENLVEEPKKEKNNLRNYKISEGDIPAEVFSDYAKFDANDTLALLNASEDVFDFTNLKIGQNIRFYFNGEDRANKMEYDKNTEEMIVVERDGDDFLVKEEKINYEVKEEIARGVIDDFFYVDALEAGLSEPTVLEVGDIFSYSIDFTTEIRQGDEFVFVYEKRKRDGVDGPDGRILAAKFVNDGDPYYAYYFDNDGEGGYYDGEGHALERQFLKAPLSYRAITSGYTGARLHPITRTVTAHYQIDYAAPMGTPVVASARGRVASAGWENGWGYIVRLVHDNGYTTHYGHLSSFAKSISRGTSISQGQTIGYVGSTGWSTGPHLDYGMKLNGAPINPLTLVQPKGAPLDESNMDEFREFKNSYNDILGL